MLSWRQSDVYVIHFKGATEALETLTENWVRLLTALFIFFRESVTNFKFIPRRQIFTVPNSWQMNRYILAFHYELSSVLVYSRDDGWLKTSDTRPSAVNQRKQSRDGPKHARDFAPWSSDALRRRRPQLQASKATFYAHRVGPRRRLCTVYWFHSGLNCTADGTQA